MISDNKAMLHDIWMSATRQEANKAFDRFITTYGLKWPRAADCLEKDRAELMAFYDLPAEHWSHLRTSNPTESTFATVRLRTYRTKGPGSRGRPGDGVQAGLQGPATLAETQWKYETTRPDRRHRFVDGLQKAA